MFVMKKELSSIGTRAVIVAITSLLGGVCFADEGPKYTYGEVGYAHVDLDDFNEADGDQIGIGGSLALTDMLHIFGSYAQGEVDGSNFPNIDTTSANAGLGLNYAVSPTIDLVGRMSYVYSKAELNNFDVDDSGFGVSGGVRAMLTPQLELNGGIGYVDFGDDNNDTSLDLGAVYSFTEMFAVTANASFSDDVSAVGVGLRLYFGA
jgi:opacity protein-like surface antigen